MIADEPVASVDPSRAREVLTLLRAVAAERDAALIVSLHDVPLARTLPRLVGLRHGQIVFDGSPDQLDEDATRALYELGP